jgi:hypothetical protein
MPLLCQARSAGLPDSCSTRTPHSRPTRLPLCQASTMQASHLPQEGSKPA